METSNLSQPVLLVTGAYGLLGSRLLPLLIEHVPSAQIIVIARGGRTNTWDPARVTSIEGDLRENELWARLPVTITHVFHLAAYIPWKAEDRSSARVVADNVLPLGNLIEQSRHWPGLRQVIYSSSVSVYAPSDRVLKEDSLLEPASLYGAAKLAGEHVLRCLEIRGIKTVSLRFSSLYAAGQYEGTVLPIMVNRSKQHRDLLVIGDRARTQDFLHCEDAARALLLCFQKEAQGVYNVGTGTPVTMSALAETVNRVFGGKGKVDYQPADGPSDSGIKLDINKARTELNFQPMFQLERGLEKLKSEMESLSE